LLALSTVTTFLACAALGSAAKAKDKP
jgi:hypothetical protein